MRSHEELQAMVTDAIAERDAEIESATRDAEDARDEVDTKLERQVARQGEMIGKLTALIDYQRKYIDVLSEFVGFTDGDANPPPTPLRAV